MLISAPDFYLHVLLFVCKLYIAALLRQECLNRDDQQFHQYQQEKSSKRCKKAN